MEIINKEIEEERDEEEEKLKELGFFNLSYLLFHIKKYKYQKIVLQFSNNLLIYCLQIYSFLFTNLKKKEIIQQNNLIKDLLEDQINSRNDHYQERSNQEEKNEIEIYITGDSTYGSLVDDISGKHINCDLIIYFGNELNITLSIPLIIILKQEKLLFFTAQQITEQIVNYLNEKKSFDLTKRTALILDPSYLNYINHFYTILQQFFPLLVIGELHSNLDVINWNPNKKEEITLDNQEVIGGYLFRTNIIEEIENIIYIGNNNEQLINILLRMSQCHVLSYNPIIHSSSSSSSEPQIMIHVGVNSREYRERYAGVIRVQEASIIGLIIGSMGISTELTRIIIKQLTELITVAGKKCYCFVMGRINEAKLCNFPEVIISILLDKQSILFLLKFILD